MSAKYALLIANTDYADPALAKLSAPGKDAEALAHVLKSPDICAFDEVNILFNESEPTVRDRIDAFFDLKKPDDLLVLYFSGHGVRDEQGSLYLAVRNTNRFRLRATAIKSDFIRESMDQSRSKRQVLILDCCNSGAFAQGTKAVTGASVGTASAFEGTGYGHVVLTASDSTQFAWEGDQIIGETQNSLFTHFLVKGLGGEADVKGNGRITVDELYDYVYNQVLSSTPKQTPSKWSYKEQGEIILRESIPIQEVRTIPLPEDLVDEIENNYPEVRLRAIQQLAKLITGRQVGLGRSAREALERIEKEDDSKRVSQAATQALESVRAMERQAEEQKRAEEEAEREAARRAEAERLAVEKAESQRLAREQAEKMAQMRAQREAAERAAIQLKAEQEAARKSAEREVAEREAKRLKAEQQAVARAQQTAAEQVSVGRNPPRKIPWLPIGIAAAVVIAIGFGAISMINALLSSSNHPPQSQPTASNSGPQAPPVVQSGTLKIVSSLPLTGASLTQTQAIVNAEKLRLAQATNQACGGKYNLTYEAWDDASAARGAWDPGVETENAQKAAADQSIIAYLGTYNSGAAKLSIPILDQAGPLVMISPSNTYPGLTKPGYGPGEPNVYYPTGVRNYVRLATADDVQGNVDANFMLSKLGVKSVYILDDQDLYYGKAIADVFEASARKLGMTVLGHESIDPKAADYKVLMSKISTSNYGQPPDGIFVGMVVDNNASQLLKDKVAIMGDNTKVKYMGPDGVQTQAFIDGAGKDVAEGVYASVAGLAPANYTAAGQTFLKDYEAKYGKLTEPYAIYGYESMNVLLAAIEKVCAGGGDPSVRKQVRDAVFATKDFNGVLGTWSFDENGDTTLTDMTVYQVQNGAYSAVGTFH